MEKNTAFFLFFSKFLLLFYIVAFLGRELPNREGVVGNRYQPVQNIDAFSFFDQVIADRDATCDAAGSLKGGGIIWILPSSMALCKGIKKRLGVFRKIKIPVRYQHLGLFLGSFYLVFKFDI
jgi:hypothetical protein